MCSSVLSLVRTTSCEIQIYFLTVKFFKKRFNFKFQTFQKDVQSYWCVLQRKLSEQSLFFIIILVKIELKTFESKVIQFKTRTRLDQMI